MWWWMAHATAFLAAGVISIAMRADYVIVLLLTLLFLVCFGVAEILETLKRYAPTHNGEGE